MKAEFTLTSTKTWVQDYPDNDFSDEVLESNFWLHTFEEDNFLNDAKLTIVRKEIEK